MAEADKLWFELGVRDGLSKVLELNIETADKLGKALDAATANFIGDSTWKDVFKNAAELESVFDKLSVTIDHVGVAQNRANGKSAEELGKMKDKLIEMRDTFSTLYEQMKKKPSAFGEKDIISVFELVEGLKLATTQAERYSKEAMNVANANDKMYEKALSDLEKFNTQWEKMNSGESRQAQLIREMKEQIKAEKEMADMRAKQTADSTEFRDMANESYWHDRARESAAVYQEEFAREEKINQILRERQEMQAHRQEREAAHAKQDEDETVSQEVVDQINKEVAQRKELQKNLDQNEASYKALNKVKLDVESQQKIAVIRNQTAEYRALAQKLADVEALMKKVKAEETALNSGSITTPIYTRDKITEELEVIQRRYNETLARGRQAELNDADAKRKNADATRRATEAAREMNRVNADMVNSFNRVLDKVTHANKMMGQLQQQFAGYVGLYGMERLLKSVIQVGGEFEVQHIALQSILGDVQQANSMFEQMKELAVVSPFNFRQLAGYSKQISAFGIPYEEIYDTTKRLADMAAGLGVDMGRLILAYGQVRSAAVLRGQELRQFTEAGIPMVQALAQEFTKLNGRAVSTAEVFELISKRAVPFEMVKKVLWDMTNEGGRFYDMQFTLSDTLAGKWSNLQDAWEIMLSDFAKGESLSGQFLKTMVSGLTALIEAANTLTPLLAGGGLFMLMRKANNAMNISGLAGIDAHIAKAQRLQAIELRRRLINQEITREQYNQGMAMNNSQSRYYLLLAQEGKLKNYQIQRLLNQKKINNARLQELVASKELTMREAAQVRLWRMKNGEMSALQMRMNNLVGGVGRFLKANIWMLVIDAAITTLTTWYARAEETEAKNKELTDGFKNVAKEIGDYYSSINGETLSSDEDYKRGIDGLKELLKQHSANYGAIIRETEALDGLEAQYNHLKIALYEEKQITEEAEDKAESFGDATRKAFEDAKESALYITRGRQSFWDVMLGADTDVERGLENSIKKLREKIVEIIPDVGNNEHANELYRKLRNSLEEQLGFGSKEKMLINIKLNELFHIDNIEDATALVVDKFGEMLAQAEPEIANKIRYGQELNQAEKDKVQQLVNDAAEETKKKYPYYADTLQGLLNDSNFVANIQLAFSTSGMKVNDLQKLVYGNMPEHLDEKVKNIATNWATSGNSFDAQNAAKKDLDASKNEKVARQKQADIAKKNLESARKRKATNDEIRKLENQERIANQRLIDITTQHNNEKEAARYGLGYDYDGELKKSNKGASGSKKDAELEALKIRVDLYKKFYQELQGYKDIYGESIALDVLSRSGEFAEVFNYGAKDLTNYKQTLDELTSGFNANTEARHKFINATKADIENKQRKDAVESMKTYISELRKMMSVMSENYQTYKKWLELTGDASLASRVAGVAQNTTYSDYLRNQMQTELGKNKKYSGLTPEDVFGLSESDIQKFGKDSQIFAVWDEWRKHQQLLRKEQLDLYEEAIKNAKNYDDKIADVNRDLEKQIAAIEALGGDSRLIENARQNAADKVSELQWDKFQKENDWGRVFGDLDNMSFETIERMVTAMKKFQKETRLSEKESRAWQKAIKDLTDKKITLDPINALTDAIRKYNDALKARDDARKAKDAADQKVKAIEREGAFSSPIAAEAKQKKLNKAIDEQTKANKALTKAEDDVTESFNEMKKAANAIANSFKDLGSSLSSLGSSVGGDFGNILSGFGTMFSQLGSGISAIQNLDLDANGFTGIFNKVSAVMTVVTSMIEMNKALASILPSTESIYQKHAEEQKKINQLREAVDSYRVAVAKARAEEQGWIGSNPLQELQEAYQIHGSILEEYTNKLYEAQEAYVESAAGIKSAIIPIVAALTAVVAVVASAVSFGAAGVGVVGLGAAAIGALSAGTVAVSGITAAAIGASIAAGVGAAIGQAIQAGIDAITYDNGQIDARSNMKVQTQHRTFFRGEKTQNLEEWVMENLGMKLFEKGPEGVDLINLEAAQAVLDSEITLVGETKETLEKLMELREQYDEWVKSIRDYISSSFGGLADDMTNAIWDWLDGSKDALDSFHDYASDTFKKIAQDAVKTFLKVAVLDKFEKQLEDLYKAYSMQDPETGERAIDEEALMFGVASIAGEMATAFEEILPVAQQLGENIANAFDYQGYDVVSGGSGSSSSVGSSIKGISETKADMLVSYINAIRADVSVDRSMIAVYYPQFLNAMSQNNTIANSQLEQLRSVVQNTSRNAEAAEMIYELLHRIAPDGTRFNIK